MPNIVTSLSQCQKLSAGAGPCTGSISDSSRSVRWWWSIKRPGQSDMRHCEYRESAVKHSLYGAKKVSGEVGGEVLKSVVQDQDVERGLFQIS